MISERSVARGWPEGYWDLFGSLKDDSLAVPGELRGAYYLFQGNFRVRGYSSWRWRKRWEERRPDMASYCEVFERKEKKYRLSARQCQFLLAALAGRMKIDAFGKTKITSLYYDTSDRRLIARSLEKPLYKEKLRVRRYGEDSERVFVEVKKKYKGIVYKRRVACSAAAARAYLGGVPYGRACAVHPLAGDEAAAESTSPRSMQISREIDRFRKRYETLRPSMTITCCRSAYAPIDPAEGELRITFDTNLAYRDEFARHAATCPMLEQGEAIMEIKNAGPMPLWLSHALAECKAYPSSFSKYGAAYRELLAGERMVYCA